MLLYEGGFVIFLQIVGDVKVSISLSLPPKQFSKPAEIALAQHACETATSCTHDKMDVKNAPNLCCMSLSFPSVP